MQLAFALSGIVDNKVLAVRLGPGGFGAFSQVAAGALALGSLVNLGLNVGLARRVAGAAAQDAQRAVSTATALVILSTGVVWLTLMVLVTAGANPIAFLGVHPTPPLVAAACILAVGLPVDGVRTNAQALLTGRGDVGALSLRWAIADVGGTLVGVPVVILAGVVGAAVQVTVTTALVAILLLRRCQILGFKVFHPAIDSLMLRQIIGVGGFSVLAGVALSAADVAVRAHLIAHSGLQANGYVQAALIIATQIKAVILGGVGSYSMVAFIPGSSEWDIHETGTRIVSVAAPLAFLSLGALGLIGGPLASVLFSRQFQPTATLLPILLTADFLEVFVWVLIGALLARGRARTWLAINLLLASLRLLFGMLLVNVAGATGVAIAYLASMTIVLIAHYVVYISGPQRRISAKAAGQVVAGGAAILLMGYAGADATIFTPWRFLGAAFLAAGALWVVKRSGGLGAIRSVLKVDSKPVDL
jgi:PST family polysaccharide transporter